MNKREARFIKSFLVFAFATTIILASCQDKRCGPIECIAKMVCRDDSCRSSVTHFWIYDNHDRLIEDSINAPDTIWSAPEITKYFHYRGDSIVVSNKYKEWLVVKVNKSGLPIMTAALPEGEGEFSLPVYNSDGTLKRIAVAGVDNFGKITHRTVDSIIYLNGNIVAYREISDLGGFAIRTVYCSYYSDKLYKQEFDPTYKILALMNDDEMSGMQHYFNVQAYSKNLLKSIRFGSEKINQETSIYNEYQFDGEGKILRISTILDNSHSKWTNLFDFKYSCQ
jgi:hypothetical protein